MPFIRLFIYLLIDLFIRSFIHSFVCSLSFCFSFSVFNSAISAPQFVTFRRQGRLIGTLSANSAANRLHKPFMETFQTRI